MIVTQSDRDAAANSSPHNERWGMLVRAGHMDADPLVQAFARHRIAAGQRGMEKAAGIADSLTPELPCHPNWDTGPATGRYIAAAIREAKEQP